MNNANSGIRFFHDPIIHLVYPPKCLYKHCFQCLWGRLYVIPREIENNTYAKILRGKQDVLWER